jgi:hypothetical protein
MNGVSLTISTGSARRSVELGAYLDARAEERAHLDAITWIKQLRHAEVDRVPLRRRFTCRGDSLWWFTEIYLHKQQVILTIFRTLAAIEALVDRERPREIAVERTDRIGAVVVPQVAAARRIALSGAGTAPMSWRIRLAAMEARARWLHMSALASRARTQRGPRQTSCPTVAAFVHRAFWRNTAPGGATHGSSGRQPQSDFGAEPPGGERRPGGTAEAYIGPVLDALERRVPERGIRYVTLGPAANFSARRWWHPLKGHTTRASASSIESLAALDRLAESRAIWAQRRVHLRALLTSAALRECAVIRNCDCWPLVREELGGVALLQWPWSARAMDEAAAALDVLQPASAVTYAEAGGWGRALLLECRRRGIRSAGLQHGFIYRHWLNYLHEPDEMEPDPGNAADLGFPRPDQTLVFDDYARQHLVESGRFPAAALAVTGSPRLDALVSAAHGLRPEEIEAARVSAGARSEPLILVVTKYREAKAVLPALLDAASGLEDVRLTIKTHPAETPDVYAALVHGRPNVSILPASAALAPLLRASRAVVTVNSTVALDAAVLNIPALVIGLPNNLSPFVEAGVMAGAAPAGFRQALHQILYDEAFRLQIETNRTAFLSRFRIGSDGHAAERSADAILTMAQRRA